MPLLPEAAAPNAARAPPKEADEVWGYGGREDREGGVERDIHPPGCGGACKRSVWDVREEEGEEEEEEVVVKTFGEKVQAWVHRMA